MTDWNAVRAEFPALTRWTYLNTATFGQLPRCATAAVAQHFAHRDELACTDFLSWFDGMDRVRASIATLVSCSADDIAFVANASSGLALVLAGLDWRAGHEVITLEDEFPNQLYALGELERRGVRAIHCDWVGLRAAVSKRTRLVAISSANYNTGFVPDLEELAGFLRARGVLLYVDGTQSVGSLRFNIGQVKPDVLCVHGYKWLCSPNGAGFVYVSPELRERLRPSVVGWRSHRGWRSVDNLHHGAPDLLDAAEKYEGGGLAFALVYAMGATVDLMLEIGPQAIEDRVLMLADQVRGVMRGFGATVADGRTAIVTARFPDADPSRIALKLRERGVVVAARKGQLRVSPHFYNHEGDVETFARELKAVL